MEFDVYSGLLNSEQLYLCRPTAEIFERSWRKDAVFEVCGLFCNSNMMSFVRMCVLI